MIERQGARIMLDEYDSGNERTWIAAPLEVPFGRGLNLQIETESVNSLYDRIKESGATIFLPTNK